MLGRLKDVGKRIAGVAAVYYEPEIFAVRAKEAVGELGPTYLKRCQKFLYSAPSQPAGLDERFSGLGVWLQRCQAALFEIAYHFGEEALPLLNQVAFGEYDWTQANATEILCRLADDGIATEQTYERIAAAFPSWRWEQVMRVKDVLAHVSARSPVIESAYRGLIEDTRDDDPVDAFELISALARENRQAAAHEVPFLCDLARGKGLEERTAFDDGHVVEQEIDGRKIMVAKGGSTYPQIPDYHQMRAATLLWMDLDKGNQEIEAMLRDWASSHPEEAVRDELTSY